MFCVTFMLEIVTMLRHHTIVHFHHSNVLTKRATTNITRNQAEITSIFSVCLSFECFNTFYMLLLMLLLLLLMLMLMSMLLLLILMLLLFLLRFLFLSLFHCLWSYFLLSSLHTHTHTLPLIRFFSSFLSVCVCVCASCSFRSQCLSFSPSRSLCVSMCHDAYFNMFN